MSIRHLLAVALLAAPFTAHAAVDCTAREPLLAHVCSGGGNDGLACTPDLTGADPLICLSARPAEANGCLGSKCVIKFEDGAKFSAELLIVADDNVSQPDEGQSIQNAVAVTVVFNFGGKKGIIAQTYQNLTGLDLTSFLASLSQGPTDTFGVTLNELRLRQEAQLRSDGKAAIVNDLLFRPQDDDLAEAMRTMVGPTVTGNPVIIKVSSVVLSDHTDGTATTLRMKVKGGFVLP
jgi:hypothetical protein